jgi:hypothetical protein
MLSRIAKCDPASNPRSTFGEDGMAAEVETIRCNFVGDFKVGDNILENANALCG